MLTISERFENLLPPLTADELARLEASILADGIRDPLVTWKGTVIDGHNRYRIATRYELPYSTVGKAFEDEDAACIWIIENQTGKRNLTDAQRTFQIGELYKLKRKKHGGDRKSEDAKSSCNSCNLKTEDVVAKEQNISARTVHNAADFHTAVMDIAKETGKSTNDILNLADKTSKQDVMRLHKMPEAMKKKVIAKFDAGEADSLADAVREQKRLDAIANLENIETRQIKETAGVYDVIVIDPPWDMKKIERDERPNQSEFDYPTMTEKELATLPIPAADNCHMWLWTTQKFLSSALRLLEAWGFKYVCTFVWRKNGGFQPFGLPQYNCEFAIYARKGTPQFIDTKAFFTCFDAPRGKHSEKPEVFYETVRRVTTGRRIDIFNRRKIEGFDTYGQEAQ